MKPHPETHQLLAHIDGELPEDDVRTVTQHLASCAQCAAIVSELRTTGALVSDTVQELDAEEPAPWRRAHNFAHAMSASTAVANAQPRRPTADSVRVSGQVASAPTRRVLMFPGRYEPESRFAPRAPSLLRWAAGIVLVTATAASAVVVRSALTDASAPEPVTATTAADEPPPHEAAVVVQPRNDGTVHVALTNVGAGTRVLVTPDDRMDASVAVIGVAAPHFIAADGRIDVDMGRATGRVHLVLPRSLRNATVTLDDATLITVRGAAVQPAHAATTGFLVDSVPPRRME